VEVAGGYTKGLLLSLHDIREPCLQLHFSSCLHRGDIYQISPELFDQRPCWTDQETGQRGQGPPKGLQLRPLLPSPNLGSWEPPGFPGGGAQSQLSQAIHPVQWETKCLQISVSSRSNLPHCEWTSLS
jgi:hypothetical protein